MGGFLFSGTYGTRVDVMILAQDWELMLLYPLVKVIVLLAQQMNLVVLFQEN